jgi:hypothetical protein
VVFDRTTQKLNQWIDGIKATQPGGEADISLLIGDITGVGNLIIGGEGAGTVKVDSVSIFNRALSDSEIGQLWNSGAGRDYTG